MKRKAHTAAPYSAYKLYLIDTADWTLESRTSLADNFFLRSFAT